jgi:hypothetical protein
MVTAVASAVTGQDAIVAFLNAAFALQQLPISAPLLKGASPAPNFID